MTDEPHSLMLDHLRAIRAENRKTHEELREIKGRLMNVETVVASMATELGTFMTADVRMQHAIDRMSDRLERIERRFDLIDESTSPPL